MTASDAVMLATYAFGGYVAVEAAGDDPDALAAALADAARAIETAADAVADLGVMLVADPELVEVEVIG